MEKAKIVKDLIQAQIETNAELFKVRTTLVDRDQSLETFFESNSLLKQEVELLRSQQQQSRNEMSELRKEITSVVTLLESIS